MLHRPPSWRAAFAFSWASRQCSKEKPRIGDARPVAVSGEMGRLPGLSHNAVPLLEFPGTNVGGRLRAWRAGAHGATRFSRNGIGARALNGPAAGSPPIATKKKPRFTK